MSTLKIHPIALCEGPRDLSQWTYRMNLGVKHMSACYIWYIEGSQPKILVDAGATADMFVKKGFTETDVISAQDGLAKYGLKPEDIDIVLFTHLHWDHIALAHLYKNARFIAQKKELEYARNPHPLDAGSYSQELLKKLDLELVDGDKEIIPGVSVLLTPGHTPGGQSIEVNTSAGKAIITGYCCTLPNFEQTEAMKHRGWEVAPFGMHHDAREAYDSVLKVQKRADIVLALHDAEFVGKETIP